MLLWRQISPVMPGAGLGVWHEAECSFFFLGVVQAEHCVEPVEESPKFDDVFGLDGVVAQVCEEPV